MACAVCLALSEWLAHGRWFFCITSGRKRAESGDKINGSSNGHPALVFSPFSPTGPSLAERWSNLPTLFHRILLSNSTRTLIHAGWGECPDGGITYLCVWCVCQHVCVCVCVSERGRGEVRGRGRERGREKLECTFSYSTPYSSEILKHSAGPATSTCSLGAATIIKYLLWLILLNTLMPLSFTFKKWGIIFILRRLRMRKS